MDLAAIQTKVEQMVRGRATADALTDAKNALRMVISALPELFTAKRSDAETVAMVENQGDYDLTAQWVQITDVIITTSADVLVSNLEIKSMPQLLLDCYTGSIRTASGAVTAIKSCTLVGNLSGTQSLVLDRKATGVSGHKLVVNGSKIPALSGATVIPPHGHIEEAVKLIAMGLAGQEMGNQNAATWMQSGLLLVDFGRNLINTQAGLPSSIKREESNARS